MTPRFPPDAGGVEEYAAWVADTLRDSGAEVTVITTGRSRRTTHETWHGIPVIRLRHLADAVEHPVNPLWWWQVRRLLRSLDVDVVNAHAPVPGLADVAAFTSPVPVVLTYHAGSLVKGGSRVDPLLRAYERHVLPRVFARCAELVAVSPVSLAHDTGRAHLVPAGRRHRAVHSSDRRAARTASVLYVGRVERTSRWKGLQVLVDALGRLRELVPDVRLEIVGDGDDVVPLQKRAADLGVGDLVDWRGRVDARRPAGVLPRAGVDGAAVADRVGVLRHDAGRGDGLRLPGRRVARSGGIPFVVRDGVDGLLVRPGDPVALADALAAMLIDPRASLGLRAASVAVVVGWSAGRADPSSDRGRSADGEAATTSTTPPQDTAARRPQEIPALPGAARRALRFRLAWSRSAVRAGRPRADALPPRAHAGPSVDIDGVARDYVRYQVHRGELRWHPEMITHLRVEGIEHLRAARDNGRGVCSTSSTTATTTAPSRRWPTRASAVTWSSTPTCSSPTRRCGCSQHVAVACIGGGTPVSAAIGNDGMRTCCARRGRRHRLRRPRPDPAAFVGRQVLGSFGAARLASRRRVARRRDDLRGDARARSSAAPAVRARRFESPQALLEAMLRIHEAGLVRWPESDRPAAVAVGRGHPGGDPCVTCCATPAAPASLRDQASGARRRAGRPRPGGPPPRVGAVLGCSSWRRPSSPSTSTSRWSGPPSRWPPASACRPWCCTGGRRSRRTRSSPVPSTPSASPCSA